MAGRSSAFAGLMLSLAGTFASTGYALAQSDFPVVVELFTSQGCSSCPPANANLVKLSERADVLVLSFAVTYWDRLGWKDTFGKPEFTDRQVTYEPALGEAGPYTPQMVVNGLTTVVGNRFDEIDALISQTPPLAGPTLNLSSATLSIGGGNAPPAGADIWLATYDPDRVEVPVGRGENGGRTLVHTHVVHDLINLGRWTGEAIDVPVAPALPGFRTAILVQARDGGPILSAITN